MALCVVDYMSSYVPTSSKPNIDNSQADCVNASSIGTPSRISKHQIYHPESTPYRPLGDSNWSPRSYATNAALTSTKTHTLEVPNPHNTKSTPAAGVCTIRGPVRQARRFRKQRWETAGVLWYRIVMPAYVHNEGVSWWV